MSKFRIDGPPDGEKELQALLDYNGIEYLRETDGAFRFLFSQGASKWETLCRATGDGAVLIYGVFPFPVEPAAAAALCQRVNGRVRYGGLFLQEDRLVFRTGADLIDIYSAYETIGRALEYNAGVITEYWAQLSACRTSLGERSKGQAPRDPQRAKE